MKKTLPITILIATIGLIFFLGGIKEEGLALFVESWGNLSVVAVCGVILATQVFAPLSGAPAMFVGFRIVGFEATMVLFYFVSLASSVINFWIARRLGRKWVVRFIGADTLDEVDQIAKSEEKFLLMWSRVFGYYIFDIISYAIGFTNVSFKKYFLSTALFTLIPWGAYFIAFRLVDMKSTPGMLAYFGSLLITAAIFGRIFWRIWATHRSKAGKETQTSN
jgi:uncharacterized membrane protein YdjX (TVP38/TMEM64 family)